MHQGIDKVQNELKLKYYYPNYLTEISNIINNCKLCNECKFDHISHKIPFKITPPTYEVRDKFVVDIWKWDGTNYVTCIDVFSKFLMVERINHPNWIEIKRALLKIFNTMGSPEQIKIDQDSGLVNLSLQDWLKKLNVEIEITTSKNGISNMERVHKTLNEKLRLLNTAKDHELHNTPIEQIVYTYNHTIVHSTTGQIPFNIFFNKLTPSKDTQFEKIRRIENLSKNRKDRY